MKPLLYILLFLVFENAVVVAQVKTGSASISGKIASSPLRKISAFSAFNGFLF